MLLRNIFTQCAATVACAIIASASLFAQGEEFDFDDIPVDEARQYYVAVGGGYLGMLTFMNFDELNKVSNSLGLSNFEGQLFINGGGGLISLLVIPNLRLGVFGAGGSRVMEGDTTIGTERFRRNLRFSSVVTAAQIDYAFRLTRSLTVLPGVMIGAGSNSLEMNQSQSEGISFVNTFQPGNQSGNNSARISRSYLFYYPALNLEYALTQFVMIRAGVGYSGSAAPGNWKDGNGLDVQNVPEIKSDGLSLQFGLFVGLFQNQ
jgi:hypothetical protein